MTDETTSLTLIDAARATGVDRRTLRRRIDEKAFPGAHREGTAQGPETGRWFIPVADLTAAGLTVDTTSLGATSLGATSPEPRPARNARANVAAGAEGELDRLRAELAEERARRMVAEAVAEERAIALEDARLILRAIAANEARTNAAGTSDAGELAGVAHSRRPRGPWLR